MKQANQALPLLIDRISGWILDIQVTSGGLILWMKSSNGQIYQLNTPFHPAFYAVLPRTFKIPSCGFNGWRTREEIITYFQSVLEQHPDIKTVTLCPRQVHAEDIIRELVLRIEAISPRRFKSVIQHVRALEVFDLYNTDLPLAQMFFYETQIFPFAFCDVEILHTPHGLDVQSITLHDSNQTIEYNLPPLRVIWLELITDGTELKTTKSDTLLEARLTVDACSTPFSLETIFSPTQIGHDPHGAPQVVIREYEERATLLALENAVRQIDPDIIFTSYGDEELFPYLLARVSYLRLDGCFSLSRDGAPLRNTRFQVEGVTSFMSYGQIYHRASTQFYLNGRLHIDSAIYGGLHFDDGNLYGIIEVARVAYTPLQRLTRVTIGGALQSLQFFHAYSLGILIPEEKKNSEDFRSGAALLLSDRGGHILQPQIGIFDQIGELDFTSMYPALMCRYNVSPETLNCPCCKETGIRVPGLSYHICTRRKGIVPLSLQVPLTKRIQYKQKAKTTAGHEATRYKKMEEALKWILVVCFGYLGFRNARFGRIEAHQTVCAFAREFLLNAKDLIEEANFQAVHGIVDSLWIQSVKPCDDATFDDRCVKVARVIESKTQIPIHYEPNSDHFRFICFLPTKQDPSVGALNRYWGKKRDGSIKVRGVEIRRHDTPPLVKQFQLDIIEAVGRATQYHDIQRLMEESLIPILLRYFQALEKYQVSLEDLTITLRLTREPIAYKVQNYQAIAATYLERAGVSLHPGQKVSFIITNDQAINPFERVLPALLFNRGTPSRQPHYDIDKYKELLVRGLTNLLPIPFSEADKKYLAKLSTQLSTGRSRTQVSLWQYFKKEHSQVGIPRIT